MLTRKRFLEAVVSGVAFTTRLGAAQARTFEMKNASFHLRLRAGPDGVWIDQLSLSLAGESAEDLLERPIKPLLRSSTAMLIEGLGWQTSRVEGIRLGPPERPLAGETWVLELKANQLLWHIERTFLEDCKLLADRFPALVIRTARQVPGFLDTAMRLDGDKAFLLDAESRWPAWSSPASSNGAFSATPRPPPTALPALYPSAPRPSRGAAPFRLNLPDRFLAQQSASFAAVHNGWMGWIFGNNPASVPALHEMAFFPMVQSIFSTGPHTLEAMEKQLTFFARTGVEPDGYVLPRWWVKGYYRVEWGNLLDQIPHFILAMYFHAVNSGHRDWLRQVMPVVDRVASWRTRPALPGVMRRVQVAARSYLGHAVQHDPHHQEISQLRERLFFLSLHQPRDRRAEMGYRTTDQRAAE